jgi:DNA-binding CsgD family transcriptional regulator
MDRKKNRSDKYQPLFAELPYSNEMMSEFPESRGLFDRYSAEDREKMMDLREQLKKEFWRLVDTELTDRQREILHLRAEGYTQIEIAKKLHVNQSSITKSINGNCDYKMKGSGKKARRYGGSERRLQKLAKQDEKILAILVLMAEIASEYSD